ncbi:Uncharacterised protein [Escherichia coli]|uniref:Uncharacterized protein n=1 Tax=Escherichia coli TaxID=562 RepID=A0A376ZNQ1_ECOLX|nr:Uncharacterised protein [Escherichia coli]
MPYNGKIDQSHLNLISSYLHKYQIIYPMLFDGLVDLFFLLALHLRDLTLMDQYHSPDSAGTHTDSIPPPALSGLSDIPPLQRIVVPVTVIVQPRLLIILLPRQPVRLVQVMRVLLIKLVAPFIIFRAPRRIAVFMISASGRPGGHSDKDVFFAQANKPALSVPPAAPPSARTAQATGGFHCSRSLPGFPPPACPAAPPVQPGTPPVTVFAPFLL